MAKKVISKKKPTKKLVAKAKAKPRAKAKPKANKASTSKQIRGRVLLFGVDEELNVSEISLATRDGLGTVVAIVGSTFRRDQTLIISGKCSPDNSTTITVNLPGANPATLTATSSGGTWSVEFTDVTGVANSVTMRAGAQHALHGTNEAVLFRQLTATN